MTEREGERKKERKKEKIRRRKKKYKKKNLLPSPQRDPETKTRASTADAESKTGLGENLKWKRTRKGRRSCGGTGEGEQGSLESPLTVRPRVGPDRPPAS